MKYIGDLLCLVVGDHGYDLHIVAATRDEEGDAGVLPDLLRVSLLLAPRTRPDAQKEEVKQKFQLPTVSCDRVGLEINYKL